MEEKIKELCENQDFIEKMKNAKTNNDAKNVFAEYGVDLTLQEIEEIYKEATTGNNEELSEENLDNVSGGVIVTTGTILVGAIVIGTLPWIVKKIKKR